MKPLKHLVHSTLGIGITLLIGAGLGYCTKAHAEGLTVGLHLVSKHIPAHDGQNNVNTGIYFRTESGLAGGMYPNTQNKLSVYLGQTYSWGPVDFLVGAVSGYQRSCTETKAQTGVTQVANRPGPAHVAAEPVYESKNECEGFARGWLTPMVVPSIALPVSFFGVTPRIWFMPSFGKQSSVVHLSVEGSF